MVKPKRFKDLKTMPASTFKKFHGISKSEFQSKNVKEAKEVGDDQCNETPPEELVKSGSKVIAKTKPFQEQHAEAGRFRPAIPHTVRSLNVASPRKDMQPQDVKKEEVESLDEISPELQHSYFKKAYAQQPDRKKQTPQRRKGMDKVINRTLRRNTLSTPGASQDFKDQEAKRGIGHVRDHVEVDGQVVESKEANYGGDYQASVLRVKELAKKKPVDMDSLAKRMQASYKKDDKKMVKEGKMGERSIDVDYHPTITKSDEPFDPPYKRKAATVTDKSGAKHSPMSRARDLARKAAQKASTPAKLKESESRKAAIVKDAAKGKKKTSSEDAFQPEPQLSSTITKNY